MINFYVVFSTITLLLILSSVLLSKRFKLSVAFILLGIFSVGINFAHLFDFLEASPTVFWIVCTVIYISVLIKYRIFLLKDTRNILVNTGKYFLMYIISTAILILPFSLAFPSTTVVTGNFISNDSVIHSIFLDGFNHARNSNMPDFYVDSYPRGIHSFTYYISEIAQVTQKNYVLLVSLICTYALIIFAVKDIISKRGLYPNFIAFGIFYPFLIVITIFLNFYPQIAVIPFLMICSFRILVAKRSLTTLEKLLIISLMAAILNIYGIFSFTIVALFFLISLSYYIYSTRSIKKLLNKTNYLLILSFILSSIPSIYLSINILISQFTNRLGSDLVASNGNIPAGFLSAIHLSGFWNPAIEYRGYFANGDSAFEYLAIAALLLLYFGIVKIQNLKIKIIIATLIALNFFSILLLKNHYIQFKYLTFLIAFQALGIVYFLARVQTKKIQILATILVLSVGAISVFTQYKYFKSMPYINNFEFDVLESINNNYLEKSSVVVLSKNDWFQYYADRENDYFPITLYLTKAYDNQNIDYVIIDNGYVKESGDYLNENTTLRDLINASSCRTLVAERYQIITINCKT